MYVYNRIELDFFVFLLFLFFYLYLYLSVSLSFSWWTSVKDICSWGLTMWCLLDCHSRPPVCHPSDSQPHYQWCRQNLLSESHPHTASIWSGPGRGGVECWICRRCEVPIQWSQPRGPQFVLEQSKSFYMHLKEQFLQAQCWRQLFLFASTLYGLSLNSQVNRNGSCPGT